MQLFQFKTWNRLVMLSIPGFVAFPVAWMFEPNSPYLYLLTPLMFITIILALIGALQGIMMAFGKLDFGCPICESTAKVTQGGKKYIYLDCPKCGEIEVSTGLGRMKVKRIENEN
jgi:predicted RNA-binding Zn-ribbon protein involved in translation (DUF1610 family)